MEEKSEKAGLKLNIQRMKIMAPGPVTSQQIEGEKNGSSYRFYFLGLQNHCRWWLQPWNLKMLAPWKKSYDKHRQCIKKQRHHFADKGPNSQSCSFSSSHVQMWELGHKEDWVLENWCFWIVVLEKTLESSWTATRSNQSILKEINPEYSLEWLLLKLKLQYFGHLMQRANSWNRPWCWERLKAKGEGGSQRWDV